MPLFSDISVKEMSDPALAELADICSEMLRQLPEEHPHRSDYEELRGRLEGEQRSRAKILEERNRAATVLQAAILGKLARDEAAKRVEEARLLEQRTKAALAIQSFFRGNKARSNYAVMKQQAAEALAQEQIRQTELQLIAKAETSLSRNQTDPARVSRDEKLQVARLLEAHEAAEKDVPSRKKASRPAVRKLDAASAELDRYVDLIAQAVKSTIAEEMRAAEAAISVVEPADFTREGARVNCGTFYFPGAGRLKISDKTYQLHPNRALVHVRDELADNATVATAQAYLDSLLAACRTVIATRREGNHEIHSVTNAGTAFSWRIIYKAQDPAKTGYSGEIFHIDSYYQNSRWLPLAKRGVCGTCGKPRNRHDNSHPVT